MSPSSFYSLLCISLRSFIGLVGIELSWWVPCPPFLSLLSLPSLSRQSVSETKVSLADSLLFILVCLQMEQTPTLPRFFHFRMVSILSSLFFVDLVAIVFFVEFLIAEQERGGLVIMFASEVSLKREDASQSCRDQSESDIVSNLQRADISTSFPSVRNLILHFNQHFLQVLLELLWSIHS